jgi:hypothetical protein
LHLSQLVRIWLEQPDPHELAIVVLPTHLSRSIQVYRAHVLAPAVPILSAVDDHADPPP